jgi:YidC/Oxa1 family membrane protein insertase
MFQLIAIPLQFFYELVPNYALAIALLTLAIMVLLLPLTLKGTRSMLAMQKLQPELKKLQNQHRDDRQKLNEEVMKFYKENNINPMSGCLPLLLQMPVFFVLYRLLYGLTMRAPYGQDMGAQVARQQSTVNGGVFAEFGRFYPHHLDMSSQLYKDLHATNKMTSFGVDLAESFQQAFGHGLVKALPYLVLVLLVTGTSYYQQRQIAGRNPQAAAANPQQQMLLKIMPLFFAFISLTLPAGIVVYFLVSNTFRIAQQAFITRTMYADVDSPVLTTGRETDKSSTKGGSGGGSRNGAKASTAKNSGKAKAAPAAAPAKSKGMLAQLKDAGLPNPAKVKDEFRDADTPSANDSPTQSGASGPSRAAPTAENRSRNKKKRK